MSVPSDLLPRVGVAVVGIPVVVGAIWFGGWWLGVLMGVAGMVGVYEFAALLEKRGTRPFTLLAAIIGGLVVLIATAHPSLHDAAQLLVGVLVAATGLIFALAMFRRWPDGTPTATANATLTSILYVSLPLCFVPFLRALPEQALAGADAAIPGGEAVLGGLTAASLVLLPLLVTWAGDASAYFTGHAIGRHKLAPKVSPGKTIEGSIGGMFGAMAASAAICHWWVNPHPTIEISLGFALGIGAVLAVATQLGDLVESLLKREAGVKDSGHIFPGHGGMLDRLDALVWAFPTTWLLMALAGITG